MEIILITIGSLYILFCLYQWIFGKKEIFCENEKTAQLDKNEEIMISARVRLRGKNVIHPVKTILKRRD